MNNNYTMQSIKSTPNEIFSTWNININANFEDKIKLGSYRLKY